MDTPKTKPDMMAASPRQGGGKRILAALEHGGKPAAKPARATAWSIDGWTVGLCLLLLLMFSVAWMMHEKTITPPTIKHNDGGDRHINATARVEMPAAEQPAAIVNEPPAASVEAPPSGATGTDQAAMAGTPSPTAQSEAPRSAPLLLKPALPGSSAAALAPRTTAAQNAAATARAAANAATAAAARDTDVTLLAALVAHANKPTVTVAERSRDVVERKEGDTTAQLLARCQQLGLIEGMLCRSRICSDRWDADAACRVPAH